MKKEAAEEERKNREKKRRDELGEEWFSGSDSCCEHEIDDLKEIDEDTVVARYAKIKVDDMKKVEAAIIKENDICDSDNEVHEEELKKKLEDKQKKMNLGVRSRLKYLAKKNHLENHATSHGD